MKVYKIQDASTFIDKQLPDMKKAHQPRKSEESTESKESKPAQEPPIPVRVPKDSKIKDYIADIQEIDPNFKQNAIINECLERYLPELLKEKRGELEERYKKVFGKKP